MDQPATDTGRMRTGWALGAVSGGMLATLAVGQPLPIVNPGFEDVSVALRPGEQTSGAGAGVVPVRTWWVSPFPQGALMPQQGVLVEGWRTLIPQPNTNVRAGVLRPDVSFAGTPWMAGYSGQHIAAVQIAHMQQTLDVQWRAGTTYTLRFLVGIGITDSEYSPFIGLVAAPDLQTFAYLGAPGTTVVARLPLVTIPREQFGQMREMSLTYTTPAVLPTELEGKYIAIAFIGSDGIPRMCYDDFRLDAVPAGAACYANCDASTAAPVLNAVDFACFLGRFVAGDGYANCDGSTAAPRLNALDFQCYLTRFGAGCG